ncbi:MULTISPECIES: hypothetical protein [Pseudomonadota]|jgi:hypothetical protein|nr:MULTISPECIES: hypothetical protein [Pseudomonadota]
MDDGHRLAAAALDLVGCPFRLHGRDPATGLDCVGLVAASLERIGRGVDAPCDYRLSGGCLDRFDGWAAMCGLDRVAQNAPGAPGDVLLCEPGVGQFHVLVDGDALLVHAHIGLGRVVAAPSPSPWPVRRRWRLQQG